MDQPSAEEDLVFVQDFVAKALAAGVDEAQARLSYGEGVEVDFGTSRLSMLRTAREDDILLTVFKSNRKGSATITGRGADAAALSENLACRGRLHRIPCWSGELEWFLGCLHRRLVDRFLQRPHAPST
jgi:hypothetical protein